MSADTRQVGDSVPVDALNMGLDRATINPDGKIQLPKDNAIAVAHDVHDDVVRQDQTKHVEFEPKKSSSSTHNMIDSLKERKHEAGAKLRKTLHIHQKSDDRGRNSESAVLANTINENSDSRLVSQLPPPEKPTLKDLVHDPIEIIKSKISGQGNHQAAANIAAKEIPHGQEVDLVNAQTAVDRARTEKERLLAIQGLSKLMKDRQSTFARWTLDRHVTKVRVIPRDTFVRRRKADFAAKNVRGEHVVDWKAYGRHLLLYYAQQYGGQYIGYGSDPPPASKETIMPNIERLIVATAPFQEFIMTTRQVYRWEDRAETTKYLLIYLALWYLNLLLPGILSAIFYMVIQRRAHGNTLGDLREDIKHREDVNRTALSLTEFIVKEGDEKWADDLLEGLGPWLMIQLADMANFFESVRNFYEWLVPSQTVVTLALFAIGILITALVPIQLMIKSMTFGAGFAFFALFPLATNFPEYRLLVSPVKVMLWNIPTHAEWAIKYIQTEGTRYEEENKTTSLPLPPLKTPSTSPANRDHGFYSAHYNGDPGRLIISTGSTRFESKTSAKVHWILPYNQINRIEKVDRITTKNIPDKLQTKSGQDLRFVNNAGEEILVKNLDKRDEAFSQIVGFSKTIWQVVW